MNIQRKLGLAIVKLRKERDFSQEKFAIEAGIDRRYMSDIENGRRNVSLDIIERISDKLGISISELFKVTECIESRCDNL